MAAPAAHGSHSFGTNGRRRRGRDETTTATLAGQGRPKRGGEGEKRQSLSFFPVVGKEIRNATLTTLVHVF